MSVEGRPLGVGHGGDEVIARRVHEKYPFAHMTILPSQQSVAARPRSGSIAARLTVRRRRWLERADPDDRFDSSPFVHGRVGVGDVVQVGLVVEQTGPGSMVPSSTSGSSSGM